MKTLTKEDILKFPMTTYGRAIGKQLAAQVVGELLQYKVFEEQLGCSLVVMFKALINGIYTKENETDNELKLFEVRGVEQNGVSVISKFCSYAECDFTCEYKDYKKTWWLKEDKSE